MNTIININSTVSAQITDNGSFPIVGKNYTLVCDVPDAESIIHTIHYQWMKSFDAIYSQVLANSSRLSISPFRLSNVGNYTCKVYGSRDSSFTTSKYVTALGESSIFNMIV